MRLFLIPFVLVFAVLHVGYAAGQSTRGVPVSGAKANPRPAVTPSPTPQQTTTTDEQAGPVDDGDIIKVNTQLVSLPVRVMDKKGRFIAGIAKEKFTVFEDGVEQEVAMFSNEHEPFTVALVLDMSYSTKFKIAEIQSAAITFIDQLRPRDRVMVISFDGEVHILCESTNDRKTIYSAIRGTKIGNGTSLYEAVDLVVNERMSKNTGRKAIILFTDGVDTSSQRVGVLNNLSDVLELDALIFPIRYDTYGDVQAMLNKPVGEAPPISSPIPQPGDNTLKRILGSVGTPSTQGTTAEDYRHAEEYLEQLAQRTGGRGYLADSIEHLSDAFSRIASELREFYSIGYYPTAERTAGKRTSIKVRVDQPGAIVRARDTFLTRTGARRPH